MGTNLISKIGVFIYGIWQYKVLSIKKVIWEKYFPLKPKKKSQQTFNEIMNTVTILSTLLALSFCPSW